MRALNRFITVLGFVAAGSIALSGQSVLNFPRLSFEGNRLTGIAIVNPSGQDAAVTITAYGEDGKPLTGIENPVTLTIPASRQLAVLTSEIFKGQPDPSTIGWFQAASPASDLTGFFLFMDGALTLLDGADLPGAARRIVFNQVRVDAGYSTELNLLNPSDASAEIEVQLVGVEAAPLSRSLVLPPKGVARLDAAAFFGTQAPVRGSYVAATSGVEITGFELVRSPGGELLGLNARDQFEQLTDLYVPQVAVLGPWQTSLGLINYSTEPVIATISVYRPDGSLYDASSLENNPVVRSLNEGQSLVEDVASMFGFRGTQTQEGWMRIESTSASVNGFVSYGVPSVGSVAAVASTAEGRTRALFSHIATIQGFFTGVAALNSGALATDLRIVALTPEGQVLGSFDTVLPPGHRISKLIDELIPQARDQNGGLIWVKSRLPLFLTSLFGNAQVLANVPSQPSPENYDPDSGLAFLRVSPPLAIVEPMGSQDFGIEGKSQALWKVDGIVGGSATVGTITGSGVYTAPAAVPSPQVVTVSAEADGQTAGASVDILEKDILLEDLGLVQSIAYLGSLDRLYSAELRVLTPAGQEASHPLALFPSQNADSEVFEVVPAGGKLSVKDFPGEEISKMIPFQASNGQEFLLLAGKASGRVIRLDPVSKQTREVATGLTEPTSLVIDPISDSLLVAEKTQITAVPVTELESDLVAAAVVSPGESAPAAIQLVPGASGDGVAVDACTGNIYFWDSENRVIRQYVRLTGDVNQVAVDLQPGQLLGFHRHGVPCPDSFRLLVAGREASQIWLVNPLERSVRAWLRTPGSTDLIFLPAGAVSDNAGVLIAELPQSKKASLAFVGTPNLYTDRRSNPPQQTECLGSIVFADPAVDQVVRQTLGLGPEARITCELASSLNLLDARDRGIRNLKGLQNLINLETLLAEQNAVQQLKPLTALLTLRQLDLSHNLISNLRPLSELAALRHLDLSANQIAEIVPLGNLSGLRILALNENQVQGLEPLRQLRNLERLELRANRISDIKPLAANDGLSQGDLVDLRQNALDTEDCPDIGKLIQRGVEVLHDVSCGPN